MKPPPSQHQPTGGPRPVVTGEHLRSLIQTFIRSIGLLAADRTPCGHPLAVSHAHALMVLLEAKREGEPLAQRDLARVLGIDKSNVARLCRRMERAGHVLQTRSAEDGRARLVSLTAPGERLATSLERSSRERFDRLMAAIPPQGRADVLTSLASLNAALTSAETPPRSPRATTRPAPSPGEHP